MRPYLFASILFLTAASGCTREVNVHLSSEELAHVQGAPTTWPKDLTLHTGVGDELRIDSPAVSFTPDGGKVVPFPYGASIRYAGSVTHDPKGRHFDAYGKLSTPGTWKFELKDRSFLTEGGKLTAAIGGIGAGVHAGLLVLTAGLIGPQTSFDYPKVLAFEGIIAIPWASMAVIGVAIWIAGAAKFKVSHPPVTVEGSFIRASSY